MIRGILFDLGGTLDGDGLHWLDRFVALYAEAGLTMPPNRLRAAFDEAERLAALDDQIASAGLDDMIERHVGWQLAHLGATADAGLHRQLVHGFVTPIRDVAAPTSGTLRTSRRSSIRAASACTSPTRRFSSTRRRCSSCGRPP